MSGNSGVFDNHSREPVPAREQVTGLRIAMIIIGIGITLPAFLVGAEIVSSLGFVASLLALATAGIILAALATLAMLVGARTHLSTPAIIRLTFGHAGSKFVNAFLASTLLGWYGVTVIFFARSADRAIEEVGWAKASVSPMLLVAFGSALMILTTIFGFRAIDRLSRIAVPLLALMLLAAVTLAVQGMDWSEAMSLKPSLGHGTIYSIGSSASLIIGGFMVGVTITPDLSRFARRDSDAVKGALLSYGSGSQLVLFMAGVPALATGEKDLIIAMSMLGLGLPALAVLLLATWTTNVNNLYSASLGFAQVLSRWRDWLVTLVAGLAGTALAVVIGMEHFIDFLVFLAVAIPPIAGIYITDFFLLRRFAKLPSASERVPNWNATAFAAWLVASGVGTYEVFNKVSASTVPALDTVVVAAVAFYLFSRLSNSKKKGPGAA